LNPLKGREHKELKFVKFVKGAFLVDIGVFGAARGGWGDNEGIDACLGNCGQ
jgi:hypothetical protein